MKILSILYFLLVLSTSGYSVSNRDTIPGSTKDSVYLRAEVMPLFQGCESDTIPTADLKRDCSDRLMMRYISSTLKYPKKAREKKIQGRVFVRFIVGKDGHIRDEEIVKDIGGDCGQEVLRVVKSFPKWTPAKHDGKDVAVIMTLPVNYRLPQFEKKKKR